MDFTAAFEDVEAPADVFANADAEPAAPDFLNYFSDGEELEVNHQVMPAASAESQVAQSGIMQDLTSSGPTSGHRRYKMAGKVGKGRHGSFLERAMVCAHMRSEKRAKKSHEEFGRIAEALEGSSLSKDGATFHLSVKQGGAHGMKLILQKAGGKGNRYVRRIAFTKFIRASFGMSTSNVALAALLGVDCSTIPRLQKTCAGVVMATQAKMLARLCAYCQRNRPLVVHHQLKWDETTVATALNPGGAKESIKSSWSVLVVRSKLLISWKSGATWEMRLVMPTIPLMSSSADQIFYALEFHPSFFSINELVRLLRQTAELSASLHEVDGAYANLRLHHHLLSMEQHDPSRSAAGSFLASARCQSHATHLISVAMLSLIGGNLLNRFYGLAVFLRNLGYLLRLQLALKQWIQDCRALFQKVGGVVCFGIHPPVALIVELELCSLLCLLSPRCTNRQQSVYAICQVHVCLSAYSRPVT